MKICAIESSSSLASVAFMEDDIIVAEMKSQPLQGRLESLVDLLESTRAKAGWAWADVEGYAAGCGPGRYAGMRVACMVARHLALPKNTPVYGVPSGAALAHELAAAHPDIDRFTIIGDARRGHLWAGVFERCGDALTPSSPWTLHRWETFDFSSDPKFLYATSDWERIAPKLEEISAPLESWVEASIYPSAVWVGRLAFWPGHANQRLPACAPIYLHPAV